MNWILWTLLIAVILVVGYFVIFFIIKFIDEIKYGQGVMGALSSAASSCCAIVKDAIRN